MVELIKMTNETQTKDMGEKRNLATLVRKGVNNISNGLAFASGLFAVGSLIYSLGIVSILPNSRINRFPEEHPEILQYHNAKSDYERIGVEEENPTLRQTLREYDDIRNEDFKCLSYAMGGLATMVAFAGIGAATEDKEKKEEQVNGRSS